MIPVKPFDSYKWRWLSVAPTESLLNPPVFLGVLRVFARHENKAPSNTDLIAELKKVEIETHTTVNLARTGDRNLIRNSGQYWKGTGLLAPNRGQIHLTPLGRKVAEGRITQGEFAAIMIQQTVLPNPWTYSNEEMNRWNAADLEIRPLKLILEIIEQLGIKNRGKHETYLTNNELVQVVIPLAGIKTSALEIANNLSLFRKNQLDVTAWPNCVSAANDERLSHEFLLFLSNFGLLRQNIEESRDEQRYYLEELFDVDAVTVAVDASIFDNQESAERVVSVIRHSPLPSIIERQRALSTVLARRGQAKFRSDIMAAYSGRCLLTNEKIPEVLEAAHIVPVTHGGSDEGDNGLCLRVDIHRLFDSGNIRIKPDGRIILSEAATASANYGVLPSTISLPTFVNPANIEWRDNYY